MYETATVILSRKLTRVMVKGQVHALPEGSTDANMFRVVEPFVPFTDYVVGYHGPRDACMAVVVEIEPSESSSDTCTRLNALLASLP